MINLPQCDACQAVLEELRAAFAEIRASPKLTYELRADGQALLGLGAEVGADEAFRMFQFRFSPHAPGITPHCRYPKIADAIQKLNEHKLRTGHTVRLRQ